LQLRVRDLDRVLDRLGSSSGRIWTPSGEPIKLGAAARIIFVQDPDGFFVELIENNTAAAADVPATSNVVGASFELIIDDSDANAAFYRRGLGANPEMAADFDATELLNDTLGTHGAAFRRTGMEIPGSRVTMAFLEFRDITRKPLTTRVQDPGTAILQVLVDDVQAMTLQLVDAGGTLVTAGGPVDINGRMQAIVRGPNNLFLELMPGQERP
jgi:predicted enzyme related to lactoylglutathione lyase